MIISLIGMSGSGKTYWSKKLEQKGFERICCDDLIEEKLFERITLSNQNGIRDVAKWMGQPFDAQYALTSKEYLACEKEVMRDILTRIKSVNGGDVVIDTTGSVIYLTEEILKKIAKETWVVYLETPEKFKKVMYKQYLDDPKPVYWGESFNRKDNETNMKALARCYPKLLAFRTRRYAKLADITLPYDTCQKKGFNIEVFLSLMKNDQI